MEKKKVLYNILKSIVSIVIIGLIVLIGVVLVKNCSKASTVSAEAFLTENVEIGQLFSDEQENYFKENAHLEKLEVTNNETVRVYAKSLSCFSQTFSHLRIYTDQDKNVHAIELEYREDNRTLDDEFLELVKAIQERLGDPMVNNINGERDAVIWADNIINLTPHLALSATRVSYDSESGFTSYMYITIWEICL